MVFASAGSDEYFILHSYFSAEGEQPFVASARHTFNEQAKLR